LSSTAYAPEITFKILTLLWTWEFDCCMGMCEWQSLLKEIDNRFRYFCCYTVCSPCGLFHLPHISKTHAASSSNERHLDKPCLILIFSCSRKDTCELLSPARGEHHPNAAFSSLFRNRASPLPFPTARKQSRPHTTRFNSCPVTQRGLQHLLALHVLCLTTPTPPPLTHENMLKASPTNANAKHLSNSFFFFFPRSKGHLTCSYFRSNFWSNP